MDVASIILVIITVILWMAILAEKFLRPNFKKFFRGSRLWPDDDIERRRIKRFLQGIGVYYIASVMLLFFSPAIAILTGFSGIFYLIISYFWLIVSKRN